MKPYRSGTLQGQQPLIPRTPSLTELKQAQKEKEDLRSRFELLNLKSPRFSLSSFATSSLKQPQPVQHSWLRDPTPPATPDPEDAGRRGGNGMFPIPPGGKNRRNGGDGRICGVQRRWFWSLLAVAAVIILGLVIGVAVGVSQAKANASSSSHSSSNSGGAGSSSTGSSGTSAGATITTGTGTTATGTTATGTTASATSTTTGGVDCPAGNGTTYTVPGSTVQFLHLCGIDYSGSGEATDLGSVQTNSMADCMDNCAGTSGCTGCGWGYVDGDSLFEHTCWLKSGLEQSHTADSGWAFAIII